LTAKFEKAALGVSQLYAQSLDDVRGAYGNKKESLTSLFDAASKAKSDRGGWIGWSVLWAIVFPPIIFYTGYKAIENQRELDFYRTGSAQTQTDKDQGESTPKGPFKTRIKTIIPQ
jgi:hypothetical protein